MNMCTNCNGPLIYYENKKKNEAQAKFNMCMKCLESESGAKAAFLLAEAHLIKTIKDTFAIFTVKSKEIE